MQDTTATTFSDTDNALSQKVDQTSENIHTGIDRASSAVRGPLERLAAGAHATTDRVAAAATQAADSLQSTASRLKNGPSQWSEECVAYVQQKPMTALAFAAAAGFVMGLAVRRH